MVVAASMDCESFPMYLYLYLYLHHVHTHKSRDHRDIWFYFPAIDLVVPTTTDNKFVHNPLSEYRDIAAKTQEQSNPTYDRAILVTDIECSDPIPTWYVISSHPEPIFSQTENVPTHVCCVRTGQRKRESKISFCHNNTREESKDNVPSHSTCIANVILTRTIPPKYHWNHYPPYYYLWETKRIWRYYFYFVASF